MKKMKLEAKKKTLPKSLIELTITVPREEIKRAIEKTYAKLAAEVEVEGFRKGKAPKDKILMKLGPILYEETLNDLLPSATIVTLEKEGLTPLDTVRYNIEKFEADGELIYTATFPVLPTVAIGNLKKIKIKKEEASVTDKEVEKVLNEMFEDWKKREEAKSAAKAKEEEKKVKDADKAQIILKYSKPNDQWAKDESNMNVKNLAELREKIRKEILKQKKALAIANYQNEIVAQAVKLSQIDIPQIFIERELERRMKVYKSRVEQLGLKFEDFLRVQKTTEEKLKEGMLDNVKAFIDSEFFLMQYAKDEKIEVTKEEIQKQIDEVKDEKTKKQFDTSEGREYIKQALLRQKAFNRLVDFVEGR